MKEYSEINRHFRDAARQLAPIRDPHAFLDTFDVLAATPAASGEVGLVRDHFERRARHAADLLHSVCDPARELLAGLAGVRR